MPSDNRRIACLPQLTRVDRRGSPRLLPSHGSSIYNWLDVFDTLELSCRNLCVLRNGAHEVGVCHVEKGVDLRKKCDEMWPVCSRCDRTGSTCIWPPPRSAFGSLGDIHSHAFPDVSLEAEIDMAVSELMASSIPISTGDLNTNGSIPLGDGSSAWDYATVNVNSGSNRFAGLGPSSSWPRMDLSSVPNRFCTAPGSRITKAQAIRMWEYAHDFGPRIIWPPKGCANSDELDPEGVAPVFRQSLMAMTRKTPIEPVFQEILYFCKSISHLHSQLETHFFHIDSTFLTRLFYDYTVPSDKIVKWLFRKFNASSSAKYGMLCMAGLFRADYERSMLASSWRDSLQEVYSLAIEHLSRDLENDRLSAWEKLTGLVSIMDYEFHTGQISKYFSHGNKAVPLIKAVIGGDTIDLLDLRGEQMFDVNMWAWCDILDSMATCSPTRLKYESDLGRASQRGTEENAACQDKGIEWLNGIPNILAVLMARISALRHNSNLSEQERVSKGAEIEQLVRNWDIRPLQTKDSRLRIARIGAQEIWRHTTILYVHHAIFKSGPGHPIVRDSVKNIIKISSTLEPGSNPDSFLYLPYFIVSLTSVVLGGV
ncbi:hypothetical protein RHS04_00341 [Rhizoctonia solani]|uniref:Zn(2)-C6 fungal-type domain-containing protein n=1 Tax=Rhizoctonia solani TaxID=456999 RepID=A0A8H7LN75_9AGAM|nr:hypothetical protein RHS04_00341 [Rhizoctonia solani]